MKKIALILAVIFGLMIAAIIIIPLVVDVDQYRPKILEIANQKINGKLSLGKLKLSLWGRIQIDAEGLELQDAQGRKIVSVKDAYFHLPYTSVLSGSPQLTLSMESPEVRVVKDANGKMNIMTLMKETAEASQGANEDPAATGSNPSESDGSATVPALVSNARIGIHLQNALLYYRDETTKNETVTRNLNLRVKDLSLSRRTEVQLSGQFESSQEEAFKISGPFKVDANVDPRLADGKLAGLGMDLNADFSDLEIQAGGVFHKKKGVTAKISGNIDSMDDGMRIEKLVAQFFNAEISTRGLVKGLSNEQPEVDISVTSNEIDLKPWNELIPLLKDYDLSGKAKLSGFAKGPSQQLQYGADFGIQELKAKSPMLKAQPVVNAEVKIVTDKVEKLFATMTAPGNDLTLSGSVVSFTAPKVDLKMTSKSLDLDQLIVLPDLKKGEDESATAAATGSGSAGEKSAAEENLDKSVNPLRENPVLSAMTMLAEVNLNFIKFYDVKVNDTQAKVSMKNLVAAVDRFSTKIFDGSIGARATVALKPATPTYTFDSTVSNLDLQKAVTSKLELFKNTLLGKVSLKMQGGGASFNPEPAKKNLDAKGSFSVKNAKFASIDISKMTTDAVNKGLEKVGDKLPGLKGKTLKPFEKETRYEVISADFTVNNGIFRMPNFVAKAEKNTGVDLKGSTTVGLLTQELKADWEIIDTYNMTKARDVSLSLNNVQVSSILAEGNNPVVIPVSIGCKYSAPCPSYGRVPEHFAKVALNNTKKTASTAVKQEVKEKAKEAGKKLLKGLFN